MKKYLLTTLALILLPTLILFIEILIAKKGGLIPFTNPSREPRIIGNGEEEITYLILGDSTSAGQGGDYERGIAVSTAKHISQLQNKKVKLINFSISGATSEDVKNEQLPKALEYQADIVLISIGGNDVTHLSSINSIKKNISEVTDKLVQKNCEVKIIFTATPDMGSVPRLAQPLRSIVGYRAAQQNKKAFYPFIEENKFTLAPIAKETGPIFRKDHSLFADDKYHPNDNGYKIWIKVINSAIDDAITAQSSHCNG
jgi:lysophospholipase L1-like esterase